MIEVRMTTCALWRVPSDLLYRLPVCQTGLPHEYMLVSLQRCMSGEGLPSIG